MVLLKNGDYYQNLFVKFKQTVIIAPHIKLMFSKINFFMLNIKT